MSEFTWNADHPLDRCRGETRRANDALRDYWLMGPGRSIEKLYEHYRQEHDRETTGKEPPTRCLRTLYGWSSKYQWQARIDRAKKILDDEIAHAELEARRSEVLGSGYALHFERIAHLNELAELLHRELNEEDKRWLPDVKQIGAGEMAERVDIVRFNAALIREYRGALADIAAELGERVKNLDIPGGIDVRLFNLQEWKAERRKRLDEMAQVPEPEDEGAGGAAQDA